MKPDTDDVWQEQRWYWRNRDLPALAGDVGNAVLEKMGQKQAERRRWSVEDEG